MMLLMMIMIVMLMLLQLHADSMWRPNTRAPGTRLSFWRVRSVVAVIIDQELFKPVIDAVLAVEDKGTQLALFYVANGLLSMVSDNVFVGTVYINEVKRRSRQSFILLIY